MQILLGLIIGASIGIGIHFLVADRATRGVALAPLIGAASAGLVWTLLTWLGFALDNPWLWLSAFVVPVVVTWPALLFVRRTRLAHDANERARLGI